MYSISDCLLTQICVTRCICLGAFTGRLAIFTQQMIVFSYTQSVNSAYPAYWFHVDSCTAAVLETAQMFPANRS